MLDVPPFGENLRKWREARGLTQDALAASLQLKSATTISQWEHRLVAPAPRTVTRLAHALDVTQRDLLDGVPSIYDGSSSQPPSAEEDLADRWRMLQDLVDGVPEADRPRALLAILEAAAAAVRPFLLPASTRDRRAHKGR